MLLCVSLVWPTKFANTLSFYAKQIWCLRIYGKCLMILILGKLGLKLFFWNTFHHILMHFVHQFQCFEVFLKCVFDFFKNVFFFLKNFVSLYLLQLIQSVFQIIEIVLKFLKKPLSVSINRNWFSINRNSWIRF